MEPIIALATSPIKSAIHIIRISGENIFKIISKNFDVDLTKDKVRSTHIGFLRDDNKNIIDQVVVITYPSPNSYTGEDVIEIMCHGNILIDNQIINLFISKGIRMATNGEFTSRAFLNKKLDLVQAEAVNDLINSTTLESKQIITYALNGETSNLLKPIKTKLLDLISNLEVNIDYPEYQDIEVVNRKRINKELKEYKNKIDDLIKDGNEGLLIKEGINVAIIGKPNVGKSTLLNTLLKEDKAIVTNIPGTTTDIVEGDVNLDGITLHLLDTAGIRTSKNKIESIGVNKAFKAIEKADLIIYLKDNIKSDIKELNIKSSLLIDKKIIEVINKADLIKNNKSDKNHLYISALNKDINPLIRKIKKVIGVSSISYSHPSFANTRELGLLKQGSKLIDEILNENKKEAPIDIISILLNQLLHIILEIFGETASLDLTKEIFSRFCVGK